MHGFVNAVLAATMVQHHSVDAATIKLLLSEQDAGAFELHDDRIVYEDHEFLHDAIAETRQSRFHGIGSCSFEEPIDDLRQINWLA